MAETLADRLKALVQRWDRGSVNAAARRIGLNQQTLDRIARGEVKNPRSDALQAIAKTYRVSVDWLLTGEGHGPRVDDDVTPWPELWAWADLLEQLQLPLPVYDAMFRLPFTVQACGPEGIPPADLTGRALLSAPAAFGRVLGQSLAAWTDLVKEWLRQAGEEELRRGLT